MRKLDSHIFKGMQRDMSVSKQSPEFLWDAHNIRLTARDGDTMLSVTNERGTKMMGITAATTVDEVNGEYIGHCVIGNYLALFTHEVSNKVSKDRIYRLTKNGGGFVSTNLVVTSSRDYLSLGFDPEHPLQTLGVYENEKIQKVYWTDGVNQPRMINIVLSKSTYNDTSFDFVPEMTLKDSISVRRTADSSGVFGAGMIQYFVSYYNKYGQESNISLASPLLPTSFTLRAGSPEERIGNSFEVTVTNPDTRFEFMRLYSIFRTSKDATPTAKRVIDIRIADGGTYDGDEDLDDDEEDDGNTGGGDTSGGGTGGNTGGDSEGGGESTSTMYVSDALTMVLSGSRLRLKAMYAEDIYCIMSSNDTSPKKLSYYADNPFDGWEEVEITGVAGMSGSFVKITKNDSNKDMVLRAQLSNYCDYAIEDYPKALISWGSAAVIYISKGSGCYTIDNVDDNHGMFVFGADASGNAAYLGITNLDSSNLSFYSYASGKATSNVTEIYAKRWLLASTEAGISITTSEGNSYTWEGILNKDYSENEVSYSAISEVSLSDFCGMTGTFYKIDTSQVPFGESYGRNSWGFTLWNTNGQSSETMLPEVTMKPTSSGYLYISKSLDYTVDGLSSGCSGLFMFATDDDGNLENVSISSELDLSYYSYTSKVTVSGTSVATASSTPIAVSTRTAATTRSSSSSASKAIRVVDNGSIGDDIDPQELLYIGGESITCETLEQKDGTLFMGNVGVTRPQVTDFKAKIKSNTNVKSSVRMASLPKSMDDDTYSWGNSLCAKVYELTGYNDSNSNVNTAGFKHREHYRLGLQFQYKTGKWSEPVYINDVTEENTPNYDTSSGNLTIPTFTAELGNNYKNKTLLKNLMDAGYVRVRAVTVFPTMQDRLVQAQGILAPTVFSVGLRESHSPDFQSSWFFRPFSAKNANNMLESYPSQGSFIENRHGYLLKGFSSKGAEIQGVPMEFYGNKYNALGSEYGGYYIGDSQAIDLGWQGNNDDKVPVSRDQMNNIFAVDQQHVTMHSPEFEFDDAFASLDLSSIKLRKIGRTYFSSNVGDIDIRTSTPCIGGEASGFHHKTLKCTDSAYADKRLCAGLFYWDWLVDDYNSNVDYGKYGNEKYEFAFMVYPWQRSTSLNNDVNRPSGSGTRSSVLETKKISNLKFSKYNKYLGKNNTDATSVSDMITEDMELHNSINSIQLFDSDQVTLMKLGDANGWNNYYGNVDMLLTPATQYGTIFSNGGADRLNIALSDTVLSDSGEKLWASIPIDFYNEDSKFWASNKAGYRHLKKSGNTIGWDSNYSDGGIGKEDSSLRLNRETIRMKYKSTPHVVLSLKSYIPYYSLRSKSYLYLSELYRQPDSDIDFGGTGDDALQANLWYPCGEAVRLDATSVNSNGYSYVSVPFSWGDTWYQRYDCLKTYAYTSEDVNQVIEVGSFMVETHVNMDGRYDRNRGQDSNINMSPTNFNLINTVYSQLDNFFNYRILDEDYYKLTNFPSMVTWSTAKNNASDIDDWTTVTLASTLEIDGTKGEITALATSKDMLYAFQEKGITQLLFNSRVMVSSSDNVPIEISNNYKVDGNRYISTAIGCNDKFSIAKAPMGIYFIDNVSKALYLLAGDQLQNVSDAKGMGYWFSKQDSGKKWLPKMWERDYIGSKLTGAGWRGNTGKGVALYYDFNKKDLYVSTVDDSLCYSELLGQFISFENYEGGILFNIGGTFHALTNRVRNNNGTEGNWTVDAWMMFGGYYNNFFHKTHDSSITFVSNLEPFVDKTFTNLECRMDRYDSKDKLLHASFLDRIKAWNEYQDTGEVELLYRKEHLRETSPVTGLDYADKYLSNTQKKFRIWRCDIPRNSGSRDRIRNTWCYIKLGMEVEDMPSGGNEMRNDHIELHDVGVVYYT